MQVWHIWLAAVVAYGLFRFWYDNWAGPLTSAEIDRYMQLAAESWPEGLNDMAMIRCFLEADDGKEFVMVNIVRLRPEGAASPASGELMAAMDLIGAYLKVFSPTLLLNGGVPYVSAKKIAGYVDPIDVSPDPGWTFAGLMRYRSRRDMMRLATDTRFNEAHKFKMAAIANAMAFPAQFVNGAALGPRHSVPLILALLSLAGTLALMLLGR